MKTAMNYPPEGLRERIAKAGSEDEIKALLDEGSTYADASERTRIAWRNTAEKRRAQWAKAAADILRNLSGGAQ